MARLLSVLQYASSVGFILVGAVAVRDWLRHRDVPRGYLAAALGLLGLVSFLGRVDAFTNHRDAVLQKIEIVLFLLSGYTLLLFRHTFLPVSRAVRGVMLGAVAVAALIGLIVPLPSPQTSPYRGAQLADVVLLVGVWAVCVGEPAYRFWRESRGRPAVQRARLRALAGGYAGIVLLLVVAVAQGPMSPVGLQIGTSIFTLGLAYVLWASFAPSGRVRRRWREPEERALRRATEELLLYAPDRHTLAERGLEWAIRLVGATSGVIADATGEPLALRAIGADQARALAARAWGAGGPVLVVSDGPTVNAVVVPLHLRTGDGALGVVPGPFTPLFGSDEVDRLAQYSIAIAAALDRVSMGEELAEQMARLRALDQMKNQFLNAVSHELRTPLATLLGLGEILESDWAALSDETREDVLRRILANTRRLQGLVADLLDLDRLRRGILEPRRRPVDIGMLVGRLVDSSDVSRRNKVHVSAGRVLFSVDAAKVERIVENLLSNTVRHTPAGTNVWIRVVDEPGGVLLVVEDDGPGVPEGSRTKIFEPFTRGPDAPAHSPGTGVGLSLVAQFAELHGGRAWVEERPGGGASFRVFLSGDSREAPPAAEASG